LVSLETGDDLGIMFSALPSTRLDHLGGESRFPRGLDSRSIAPVGNHHPDPHAGQSAVSNSVSNCEEVRSATGEQDAQATWPGIAHA
jgi:hypothetical protein